VTALASLTCHQKDGIDDVRSRLTICYRHAETYPHDRRGVFVVATLALLSSRSVVTLSDGTRCTGRGINVGTLGEAEQMLGLDAIVIVVMSGVAIRARTRVLVAMTG
jgi:hypothetical protein